MEDVVKLKKQLTRTRVVVFILLTLCILFFVFAQIQTIEAKKNMELANEHKVMADQARVEAERQHMISIVARNDAEQQRILSEEHAVKSGEKHESVEQLKKELEAQRKIAEQQKELAIKNAEMARRMEILAKQNEMIAKNNELEARRVLEECQKSKKQ